MLLDWQPQVAIAVAAVGRDQRFLGLRKAFLTRFLPPATDAGAGIELEAAIPSRNFQMNGVFDSKGMSSNSARKKKHLGGKEQPSEALAGGDYGAAFNHLSPSGSAFRSHGRGVSVFWTSPTRF
jgi:hypothetical protein